MRFAAIDPAVESSDTTRPRRAQRRGEASCGQAGEGLGPFALIRRSLAVRRQNATSQRDKRGVSHNGPIHQTDTVVYGSQIRKQRFRVELR